MSYIVIMGLIFTLGILAQVGARSREVESIQKNFFDILPLGHHLRRPARVPQPRWRPKLIQLRVWFGVQEQSILKRMPTSQTELDLDVLYMDGNIISRHFKWHYFQAQIQQESIGIVRTSWHPESDPALQRHLSVFGPCIVLEPIRGTSRASCAT